MSILDEHLKNYSWPNKKKSLFSERKDWWNNASLRIVSTAEGLAIYSRAYKDAGDRLVEYAKTDKFSINFLVFPILFLYRHHIELALKEIINEATQYLKKEYNVFSSHKLSSLWFDAKKFILEAELDIPSEDFIAVENQILQFDELDKSSMTFRYPVDKNGSVFKNLSDYINIENIREIVDGLYSWFFGVACVLGEYNDLKNQYI